MSNNLRTRNGMPFNFVNGLKVRGMDIESLIPGIEGIPEAGSKYQFAGNGSNKVFTLPVSPYNKDAVDVYVKQLYVHPDDYTLVGDVVTLTEAPPALDAGETYNVVVKVSLTTLNGYVNANRVSFEGENLDDILEKGKPLTNYSNLRAYAGAATQVRITDPGIAGFFYYDATDTTSVDNGGTVVVSSNGKRWKRLYDGAVNVKWFGAKGDWDGVTGTDDTAAIQNAINASAGNVDFGSSGVFKVTGPIGLPTVYITDAQTMNLVANGAAISVQSAEAIFTSARSLTDPESTSNLYTSKINVKGLSFIGYGTSVVFNGDRLYNLVVQNCNFKNCTKVIYSYRNKGADYSTGYLQSVQFSNCHFATNTKIVDAKMAFNFLFDSNICENNISGVYIDGVGDPAINTLRIINNCFEAGGVFVKLGAVIGGLISGNYIEANTLQDTTTLKCHIYLARESGGYTSGLTISNNTFAASASQKIDVDWRDIKFNVHSYFDSNISAQSPIIHGNWSNSYQLVTTNSIILGTGNGGAGGDMQSQRSGVPTLHTYAGVSFSRRAVAYLASAHLAAGVFTVGEISVADIKALLPATSARRAQTAELTIMAQPTTVGGIVVGAAAIKILLIIQGAQGGGDVDSMFVNGSLISFTQITNGNVFDTRYSSELKQHFTNPALSIVPNGTDNFLIKLSGYAAPSVPNYGPADRISSSIIMQSNANSNANQFRGLLKFG